MKRPLVIHRSKHDKPDGQNIAIEPEMIELKRMIRAGELDADRAATCIKGTKGANHEEEA